MLRDSCRGTTARWVARPYQLVEGVDAVARFNVRGQGGNGGALCYAAGRVCPARKSAYSIVLPARF